MGDLALVLVIIAGAGFGLWMIMPPIGPVKVDDRDQNITSNLIWRGKK